MGLFGRSDGGAMLASLIRPLTQPHPKGKRRVDLPLFPLLYRPQRLHRGLALCRGHFVWIFI